MSTSMFAFWILSRSFWDIAKSIIHHVFGHPPTQPRAHLLYPPYLPTPDQLINESEDVPPPASSYATVIDVVPNVPSCESTSQPSLKAAVTSQYAPQDTLSLMDPKQTPLNS